MAGADQVKVHLRSSSSHAGHGLQKCYSHLHGMSNGTVRLLEAGLKPVFMFDGEPPDLRKKDWPKDLHGAERQGDKVKLWSDVCIFLSYIMVSPVSGLQQELGARHNLY